MNGVVYQGILSGTNVGSSPTAQIGVSLEMAYKKHDAKGTFDHISLLFSRVALALDALVLRACEGTTVTVSDKLPSSPSSLPLCIARSLHLQHWRAVDRPFDGPPVKASRESCIGKLVIEDKDVVRTVPMTTFPRRRFLL